MPKASKLDTGYRLLLTFYSSLLTNMPLLFIHGLEGTSQGFKPTFLRTLYPQLIAPDFPGDFAERMARLEQVTGDATDWTIIGSSLGGLMAAFWAGQHPDRVARLVLLAPALPFAGRAGVTLLPCPAPTVIVHGEQDPVVPMVPTRRVAEQLFSDLAFHVVHATHDLNPIVPTLDWAALLEQ